MVLDMVPEDKEDLVVAAVMVKEMEIMGAQLKLKAEQVDTEIMVVMDHKLETTALEVAVEPQVQVQVEQAVLMVLEVMENYMIRILMVIGMPVVAAEAAIKEELVEWVVPVAPAAEAVKITKVV